MTKLLRYCLVGTTMGAALWAGTGTAAAADAPVATVRGGNEAISYDITKPSGMPCIADTYQEGGGKVRDGVLIAPFEATSGHYEDHFSPGRYRVVVRCHDRKSGDEVPVGYNPANGPNGESLVTVKPLRPPLDAPVIPMPPNFTPPPLDLTKVSPNVTVPRIDFTPPPLTGLTIPTQ